MRRIVLSSLHAVALVYQGQLLCFVGIQLHVDEFGVGVYLCAETLNLVLQMLPHFLLTLQSLGVVVDLPGVESGWNGTAF